MPYRYWCTVLDEMRECFKTHNYAPMAASIEELQIMGDRMESALGEKKSLETILEHKRELRKERDKLKKQVAKLKKKVEKHEHKLNQQDG